jgi:hypothetical protein
MAEKKYAKLVFSGLREDKSLPFIASPQAYFRGEHQIPGSSLNMGWQLFTRPVMLEKEAHTHDVPEYLIFLGNNTADFFSSFNAEIDLFLGEEMEKYVITCPTIVYIPPEMSHCPLNFRVLNQPVMFSALLQSPVFTKTVNGKTIIYRGPDIDGPINPDIFK